MFILIFASLWLNILTQNICPIQQVPEAPYLVGEPAVEQYFWNYDTQDNWNGNQIITSITLLAGEAQPQCSNQFDQSPIDLVTGYIPLDKQFIIKLEYLSKYAQVNQQLKIARGFVYILQNLLNLDFHGSLKIDAINQSNILMEDANSMTKLYESQFITIKFPSEHKINGFEFDGEVQITYKANPQFCSEINTNFLVLSYFLIADNVEKSSLFFQNLTNPENIPITGFDFKSDLLDFLKSSQSSALFYQGSLTYPPCNSSNWLIITTPRRINTETLMQLNKTSSGKKRNIQSNPIGTPVQKGIFVYLDDFNSDEYYDSTSTLAAVWAAPIASALFILLVVLIYGIWKLSGQGKNLIYRQVEKEDEEKLFQTPFNDQATQFQQLQGIID